MTDVLELEGELGLPTVAEEVPRAVDNQLTEDESSLADSLATRAIAEISGVLMRFAAKPVASRLLEKLGESQLPESSVGLVVEGVWRRVNQIGATGEANPLVEDVLLPEMRIVEDIFKRPTAGFFLTKFRHLFPNPSDAGISGRVIRAAANRAWPEVRAVLDI